MGKRVVTWSMEEEALATLDRIGITERKRGEYVSNLLLAEERIRSSSDDGILERVERLLARLEMKLERGLT